MRCATCLPSRCRMHVCWGNYEGPHHCDVEMEMILPTLMQAKPAGSVVRNRQPAPPARLGGVRRRTWRSIPADKVLIPGVIDSTTNFIEHPRVVRRPDRAVHSPGRRRSG